MVSFETAIGACRIDWSESGITRVELPARARVPEDARDAVAGIAGPAIEDARDVPAFVRDAVAGIVALLAGEPRDLREVPLDEDGIDDFRRAVYAATRAVGPGETASYGEIARAIGRPDAARAVGAALGANPYPVVVPCHRVLAADGALTGFSAPGGLATKRRMLEIEGAPGFAQVALFA
jgi:methylated-DNA-[protein]-cysteine S-methyltransferase